MAWYSALLKNISLCLRDYNMASAEKALILLNLLQRVLKLLTSICLREPNNVVGSDKLLPKDLTDKKFINGLYHKNDLTSSTKHSFSITTQNLSECLYDLTTIDAFDIWSDIVVESTSSNVPVDHCNPDIFHQPLSLLYLCQEIVEQIHFVLASCHTARISNTCKWLCYGILREICSLQNALPEFLRRSFRGDFSKYPLPMLLWILPLLQEHYGDALLQQNFKLVLLWMNLAHHRREDSSKKAQKLQLEILPYKTKEAAVLDTRTMYTHDTTPFIEAHSHWPVTKKTSSLITTTTTQRPFTGRWYDLSHFWSSSSQPPLNTSSPNSYTPTAEATAAEYSYKNAKKSIKNGTHSNEGSILTENTDSSQSFWISTEYLISRIALGLVAYHITSLCSISLYPSVCSCIFAENVETCLLQSLFDFFLSHLIVVPAPTILNVTAKDLLHIALFKHFLKHQIHLSLSDPRRKKGWGSFLPRVNSQSALVPSTIAQQHHDTLAYFYDLLLKFTNAEHTSTSEILLSRNAFAHQQKIHYPIHYEPVEPDGRSCIGLLTCLCLTSMNISSPSTYVTESSHSLSKPGSSIWSFTQTDSSCVYPNTNSTISGLHHQFFLLHHLLSDYYPEVYLTNSHAFSFLGSFLTLIKTVTSNQSITFTSELSEHLTQFIASTSSYLLRIIQQSIQCSVCCDQYLLSLPSAFLPLSMEAVDVQKKLGFDIPVSTSDIITSPLFIPNFKQCQTSAPSKLASPFVSAAEGRCEPRELFIPKRKSFDTATSFNTHPGDTNKSCDASVSKCHYDILDASQSFLSPCSSHFSRIPYMLPYALQAKAIHHHCNDTLMLIFSSTHLNKTAIRYPLENSVTMFHFKHAHAYADFFNLTKKNYVILGSAAKLLCSSVKPLRTKINANGDDSNPNSKLQEKTQVEQEKNIEPEGKEPRKNKRVDTDIENQFVFEQQLHLDILSSVYAEALDLLFILYGSTVLAAAQTINSDAHLASEPQASFLERLRCQIIPTLKQVCPSLCRKKLKLQALENVSYFPIFALPYLAILEFFWDYRDDFKEDKSNVFLPIDLYEHLPQLLSACISLGQDFKVLSLGKRLISFFLRLPPEFLLFILPGCIRLVAIYPNDLADDLFILIPKALEAVSASTDIRDIIYSLVDLPTLGIMNSVFGSLRLGVVCACNVFKESSGSSAFKQSASKVSALKDATLFHDSGAIFNDATCTNCAHIRGLSAYSQLVSLDHTTSLKLHLREEPLEIHAREDSRRLMFLLQNALPKNNLFKVLEHVSATACTILYNVLLKKLQPKSKLDKCFSPFLDRFWDIPGNECFRVKQEHFFVHIIRSVLEIDPYMVISLQQSICAALSRHVLQQTIHDRMNTEPFLNFLCNVIPKSLLRLIALEGSKIKKESFFSSATENIFEAFEVAIFEYLLIVSKTCTFTCTENKQFFLAYHENNILLSENWEHRHCLVADNGCAETLSSMDTLESGTMPCTHNTTDGVSKADLSLYSNECLVHLVKAIIILAMLNSELQSRADICFQKLLRMLINHKYHWLQITVIPLIKHGFCQLHSPDEMETCDPINPNDVIP